MRGEGMKNLSLQTKIILWFSSLMIMIAGLTVFTILYISRELKDKNLRNILIRQVEDNVDEVEFFASFSDIYIDHDSDIYMEYNDGYLEIDDDYLDLVNNIYTSLYDEKGVLLYGENPIRAGQTLPEFSDHMLRELRLQGKNYLIYDRALVRRGVEGLWLRGVISVEEGMGEISQVTRWTFAFMPLIILISIIGGFVIAKKALQPIETIRITASQISEGGDLKQRIDIGPGKDEVHRLAQVFNAMFARLHRAFETEKRFTADASHELRTPMAVILAECEYALSSGNKEEYKEALELIFRQGKKMSALIGDMLDFSRIEAGEGRYDFSELDLSELLSGICGEMSLLGTDGLHLRSEIESGVCIRGNAVLLSRMFSNIINNAFKYGERGKEIFVGLKKSGRNVEAFVRDEGIGMSEDEIACIFDRFYQADASHSGGGAGLGLPMAKEIAALHGADIEVESVLGEGSTFRIRFFAEENQEGEKAKEK
ncbi:MAG: HAMP domain-containing sensor histidine kinase [Johnsonella sp.]|nr:HAMP domain-containing sensor histidine kinase [Johnsonella sp.]